MEPDFTGWATKANLKCSDGRTIAPDAFKHQDQQQVPLLWQHGHKDPENVLGHVYLINHEEGVRVEAFFNDTPKAQHAKALVDHKDIKQLSIWANELIERGKMVFHGAIKEVSLVLAGANPGATIDPVVIRHENGDYELEDDFIITTGEPIVLSHADGEDIAETDDEDGELTVQEVYDSMDENQKELLQYMVAEAIAAKEGDKEPVKQSDIDTENEQDKEEGTETMSHNLFEEKTPKTDGQAPTHLSHDAMAAIFTAAQKDGSLADAVSDYAIAHGITDIEKLFPDAEAIDAVPEWIKRRTEWVGAFLGACRKSPFNRIKTLSADITHDEARAKGYIKGTLKKEEFFSIKDRTTVPTTVYKKQKLDRDDMVDITDFDVVAWMKAEMRIMLDEEIARAALIGDGRDVSDDDKINEQNIRPIAKDHELYTTQVYVNINDASSSIQEFIDAVVTNRYLYRGTGLPTMYTTEIWIAQFLLLKDSLGRRIYKSLDELATELRVSAIVPVEVMEDEEDIIAIFVNPADYVMGATRGGEVTMFDDFDIDYNQYKYLIETRLCGALVKVKSAMVFRKVAGTDVLVAPNMPTFNTTTGVLTIVNQTGVVYKDEEGTVLNAAGSPYAAIDAGASRTVYATPASGYYFATSNDDEWTFTRDA
jgi:HK97 family phage prohead protease